MFCCFSFPDINLIGNKWYYIFSQLFFFVKSKIIQLTLKVENAKFGCILHVVSTFHNVDKKLLSVEIYFVKTAYYSIVKSTLISRSFCKSLVRINLCNFHITEILSHTALLWQKFRESNDFTKVTKDLISRKMPYFPRYFFYHGPVQKQSTAVYTLHCGNCRMSLSHFFRKNFVKALVLLKEITK